MDTIQLIELLKSDKYSKKYFCGVLPIDRLPIQKIKRPCSFIINTDNSNLSGKHWFALFVPKYGKIEYFDSYGLKPINKEIYNFIKLNGSKYIYNRKKIQSNKSINCGKFSIFYLYLRSRKFKMKKITNIFVYNKHNNDLLIDKIFNKLHKF